MRKRILIWVPTGIALVTLAMFLPTWFQPSRWHEISPGLHRSQVHAVLGVPDADFSEIKGFEGWVNTFGIGASVLTVHYSQSGHVNSTKIQTLWGFDHRNWLGAYKNILRKQAQ